ncbi:KH-domain-containing protein [Mycena indigotica]|uniref:KH-domain-containing protein n=1 Tax=Mycena indigotica TaxID=2126181 RepID=A0A8H6T3A0_9AGAR|nr:KH-domain-containing protein [Mycena indigotica]KAF7309562.1 KH-domain-containing protein [Mycena indigotica]
MSSKRKWDQAAPDSEDGPEPKKLELSGEAAEAAARAAAIASKIAAQFSELGAEEAFSQDIDINDVRNRYMLTKATTQQEIKDKAGGNLSTKGIWYPDRTKATERDPPLYLHVTAKSAEILKRTVDVVHEYIAIDMGSLVEDKKKEKRKWPEEKLPVGLETIRNFNIRAKVVGPSGSFVKYIQQETQTRVQIKGIGSGFVDQETGRESDEPLYIHITGPEEQQVARAKVLTEDLLSVVRIEHAKVAVALQHEQMELRNAQMQYTHYGALAGGYGSAPDGPAPDQPPPPSGDQFDPVAFNAYWANYGYDTNSQEFRDWVTQNYPAAKSYYDSLDAQGSSAPVPPSQPAPPPPPTDGLPPPPPPA